MIPDIGWVEFLVIAVLAIVVVGPKELPRMMRILGQWVSKARGLAREFQRSFDDLVRESELDELRKEVEDLRKMNPIEDIKKSLDPTDELRELDKSIRADLEGPSEPIDFGADLSAGAEAQEEARDEARKEMEDTSKTSDDETGGVKP